MKRSAVARLVFIAVIAAAVLPAAAESPDEIYSFATHLKKDGMLEAAAQQFLKFARENPNDPRAPGALFEAADCLADSENTPQAITVLETIASTYPDHPDQCRYQLQLGRLLYKAEEYAEADRVFTRLVVTMPGCEFTPDALLGKAEALISMKQFGTASEVLRNLLDNYMESQAAPRASYDLAYCLRQIDRPEEALQTYERIVVQFPSDPLSGFAALEAARMHAEQGDTKRAIEYYARARDFGTAVFVIPAGLEGGDLLVETGDYALALRWYQQLLAEPQLEQRRRVYIKAVGAAYDAGEYGVVQQLAAEYAEQYPGTFSPQMTYTTALASLKTKDYEAALDAAARLEAFAPETEWARSSSKIRGDAFLGKGQPREAVDQYHRFVAVSSDSASKCAVLRDISDISFDVTRDTTTALEALDRLLDVEQRRYPGEMLVVAGANERVGRYQKARSIYDDLIRRFPLSDEAGRADDRAAYLDEFAVTDLASAAVEMDRAAYDIATAPRDEAMIRLLDARINATKNFQGALTLSEQLKKTTKGKPQYPDVLYYEGLAWAKLARRDLLSAAGNGQKSGKERAGKAEKSWKELIEKYPQATKTPSAAFERVMLQAQVDGELDPRAAAQMLSTYPNHPEGERLTIMLGDYYAARDGEDDLKRAAAYYANALQLDPGKTDVQLKRARVIARQGNEDGALAVYTRLAEGGETRVALEASYEAGRVLRQTKRYREAITYFDRVAEADPSGSFGANAALQAADCVYMLKNYEGAMARYEAAERIAPSPQRSWEISYRIALCLKQTGQYREALVRLTDCLLSDEGGAQRSRVFEDGAEVAALMGDVDAQITILEAYVNEVATGKGVDAAERQLVRLYLSRGQAEEARVAADRLVRSAPKDDPEPRALLAMAMYRQGDSRDAAKEREKVVKMAGADSDIVREIGIEAAKHQYDIEQYRAAAESVGPYAESCRGEGICEDARYLYAMSLLAARDLKKGSTVAQAFFRDYPLSPKSPELHLRMGNVLSTANRTSESLLHYQEAAETASDTTVAFMALKNLGISYQKLKRWSEAERVWATLLQRSPTSEYASEAALNQARCRMEQGDYRGAIAAYEEAMPLLDTEARARAFYWMGTSYEQLGDYQAAVVEYLKVPYLASGGGMWVVTAQLKAAECYVKIKRDDAAREIYNKVIQNHGAASNWGKIAQKALDEMNDTAQSDTGGGQR